MEGFGRIVAAAALLLVAMAARAGTLEAIEYYDATLDHYFVTSFADEIAKLDAGVFAGWQRTGQHFTGFDPATPVAGASPVCRFYGLPSAGLDSHFYSASPAECQAVLRRFPGVWEEETQNAFGIYLPNTETGACPAQTIPVYRAWNARVDSNHRFTTDLATLQAMIARGYVAEGYGPAPYPVAMCSPACTAPPPAGAPKCTVRASTASANLGDDVTLTASCTNAPASFTWTNCASTTSTCTTTSAAIGPQTYTVYASNAAGQSAAASVTVLWQTPPPAPVCTIVRTSQTDPPAVGGSILLEANCDQAVGSYSWNGCGSLTNTCVARETTPGLHTYSLIARNAGGSSPPATLGINWVASATSAPGFCGQFPSYLYSDFDTRSVRVESVQMPAPAFAWNGVWTVRFVVPPTMPSTVFGQMASAEFAGPPTIRQATISQTPCDFRAVDPSGASGPFASSVGSTNTILFSINPSRAGYPVLAPGGTYYYNVRNFDPATNTITCSPGSGRCDALVESRLPG
jgi:hypothetical protein